MCFLCEEGDLIIEEPWFFMEALEIVVKVNSRFCFDWLAFFNYGKEKKRRILSISMKQKSKQRGRKSESEKTVERGTVNRT